MTIITPEGIQAEMTSKLAQKAQEEGQYKQFLASLAFELYSNNVDPGMSEKAHLETAGWALEAATAFIETVNTFEV